MFLLSVSEQKKYAKTETILSAKNNTVSYNNCTSTAASFTTVFLTLSFSVLCPGLPIKANNGMQKKILKALLASGELVSGESTLKLGQGNVGIDAEGLHLPNGFDVALGKKPKRRNLAVVTGVKPILVVKVIDSGGLARPESPAIIGDNIFGTIDDPVNLASQMKACSFGQLDIVPGPQTGGLIQDAPGVITITIPVSLLDNSRSNIRNAVTTAAQVKLGFNLPGPYQQVMYVLENCYVDCGWAAYAYVNSWNSVYQGNYYYMTGVLMHGEYLCRRIYLAFSLSMSNIFFLICNIVPTYLFSTLQSSAITSILLTVED